jgi:hypothetical protein
MTIHSKVLKFPKARESATVEIQRHPEAVIDVDPQILAVMKARLAGESLADIFSRDDQNTNELAIERERQNLKAVFPNAAAVFGGFSSLEAVKVTRSKLKESRVDRELLSLYASKKSAGQAIDEADLYAHLLSGCELRSKQARIESLKEVGATLGREAQELISEVSDHYLADAFGSFAVSKEMIELSPEIRKQFKGGELQGSVDEVLKVLYGRIE